MTLAGQWVVITGKIEGGTRKQWDDAIMEAGGYPQGSVTPMTDLLVVGEKPGKGKLDGARKYRTRQITADEFRKLVNAPMMVVPQRDLVGIAKLEDMLAALKDLA